MWRYLICAPLVLLAATSGAPAFDVTARITQVDREQGMVWFAAGGQKRAATVAPDAKFLDVDGKELAGGLKSDKLKEGVGVVLTVERVGDKPVIKAIQLGNDTGDSMEKGRAMPTTAALPPQDTTELTALTDMGPEDEYLGAKGGLYPGCSNARPAGHEQAGVALARQVRPLDANGQSSPDGRIVLLTIGFSNTSMDSAGFIKAAAADKDVNPRVTIVNGAQGGRSAVMIQDPGNPIGAEYWTAWVPNALEKATVNAAQVQAIWLKETDASLPPSVYEKLGMAQYDNPLRMPFPKGAQTLEGELERIVRLMPGFFPNLKLVYVSSRSYGGWALREGNREPWSYETGYAVKWLIERQLTGEPTLNFDPSKGKIEAPWLSWGSYLWANGDRPRKDGFSYQLDDYRENDRMHPSPQGQRKIGTLMLQWFKNDATARLWFVAEAKKNGP